MLTQNEKIISNLSYVNKDYESIMEQLIETVKKISYRWDPSISNESDPGVVLMKLNAIIGDKTAYNIDKNILEAFPVSVSQEGNARKVFEQCGYSPLWYQAATTKIGIKWKESDDDTVSDATEQEPGTVTIPRFTMVSDDEHKEVFTLTGTKNQYTAQVTMSKDADAIVVDAQQGVAVTYTVGASSVITPSMLDEQRRLYINARNIAQNGIWIHHTGQEDYAAWEQVENLEVQDIWSSAKYFYKFGVNTEGTACYLEFTENLDTVFGEGIEIVYILTDGSQGNVAIKTITELYSDVTITGSTSEDSITLSNENLSVVNTTPGLGGSDPESIENAYRNYKRRVGTFTTLVSLRDYINAILTSGLVSNAVVSDRTNDPQQSYHVLTTKSGVTDKELQQEEFSTDASAVAGDLLTAFDLRMCLLQDVNTFDTNEAYKASYEVVSSFAEAGAVTQNRTDEAKAVEAALQEDKSVQHDYAPLLVGKTCMIRNKYLINATVLPQYRVTTVQASEIQAKVFQALRDGLNASAVNFGQEVEYEDVYNIILNADSRIKAVAMDDLKYTPYAVYVDANGNTVEEELPTGLAGAEKNDKAIDIYAKSVLNGNTRLLTPANDFNQSLYAKSSTIYENVTDISTETSVSPGTGNVSTLQENESITFFAPNFVDKRTFGSYVIWQYSVNGDIPANTDYTLQANDKVAFYWRDSDEDNYKALVLGEGDVIRPTFKTGGGSSAIQAPMSALSVSENVQQLNADQSDAVAALTDSSYFLTAKKTIAQRSKAAVEIGDKKLCYWVLNTAVKNESGKEAYQLFAAADTAGTEEYILRTEEYFVYAAEDASSINILSPGTTIIRTHAAKVAAWECPISAASISSLTEESRKQIMVKVQAGCTVSVQENQVYTLSGEGAKVEASGWPTSGIGNVVKEFPVGATIKLTTSSGSTTSLPEFTDGTQWKAYSSLALVSSPESAQRLYSGQTVTLYSGDEKKPEVKGDTDYTYICMDAPYNLIGGPKFSVERYNKSGNLQPAEVLVFTAAQEVDNVAEAIVKLPKEGSVSGPALEIAPVMEQTIEYTSKTEGKKTFNLKVEAGEYSGTTVLHCNWGGQTSWSEGDGLDTDFSLGTAEVEASKTYSLPGLFSDAWQNLGGTFSGYSWSKVEVGGTEVPITVTAAQGENTLAGTFTPTTSGTATFYMHYHVVATGGETNKDEVPICQVKTGGDAKQVTLPATLTAGNYVVRVDVPQGLSYLAMKASSLITPIGGNKTDIHAAGTYYMNIVVPSGDKANLQFSYSYTDSSQEEISLTLGALLQYSNSGTAFDSLLKRVSSLDTDGIYDYMYVPDSDELIENPLAAESYFNTNHWLNRVTLPMIDFDSQDANKNPLTRITIQGTIN